MGLVDYSSDDSDAENVPNASAPASRKPTTSTKPAFQKVVDKSAPNRIRVNLSAPESPTPKGSDDPSEPPAKRPRLGAGGGFNSFLPAAKKAPASGSGSAGGARGKGLGRGVSLKTGPEAAFSREPMPPPGPVEQAEDKPQSNEQAERTDAPPAPSSIATPQPEDAKTKGKTTMFRPLSVARKPTKKKPAGIPPTQPAASASTPGTDSARKDDEPAVKRKPKVSLFSMEAEQGPAAPTQELNTEYQPLLHGAKPELTDATQTTAPAQQAYVQQQTTHPSDPNSLGVIANDLNLTASQRRQLFGRGGKNPAFGATASAVNVVNFNTDAEYAANEELRAAGEQPEQQHKAVRTVNTSGRNSLRQLVNVVQTQGDALEEHFAKGKRNKAEAGSKYGW